MSEFEYRCPMYTPEVNLEIAIGGIKFRDKVIKNLRQQIFNLRHGLKLSDVPDSLIDELQYVHLRDSAETTQSRTPC